MTDPGLLDEALYAADPVARDGARARLIRGATAVDVEGLIALFDAPTKVTRRRDARILSEFAPTIALPPLRTALLGKRSERIRSAAARVMTVLKPREEAALAAGLQDPSPRVRRACATAGAPISALITALCDENIEVAGRAAESIYSLGKTLDSEQAKAALNAHPEPPAALIRLAARAVPDAPELGAAAERGDATALDHLRDVAVLGRLRSGPNGVAATWALGRGGHIDPAYFDDPNPDIRAVAARHCPPEHPRVVALQDDSDARVAWFAKRNVMGDFSPLEVALRLGPHERLSGPSAQPPYGLRETDELPPVPRIPAALALCHTRFDVNLGVAVRSAEAAGLSAVYLVGRGELFRSPARGTDLVLPVHHAQDAAALLRAAREGGYQIVVVQQTPNSVPYHEADYPPRPLFVLGAEDDGVPQLLRAAADLVVEIPLHGVIDSLNVAAAATTVMLHWSNHRG